MNLHPTITTIIARVWRKLMLDLHCHILPNVDDGRALDESLQMAQIASQKWYLDHRGHAILWHLEL